MREVISRVWLTVGKTWDCGELVEMAEKVGCRHFLRLLYYLICFKALSFMPASSFLPSEDARTSGQLADSEVPVHISPINDVGTAWSGVVPQAAVDALASNKNALEATGMDRETLQKRLSVPWTAESAFRDCRSNCRNIPKHACSLLY
jgi:hypothetical protein